jgi:hypothetical protein
MTRRATRGWLLLCLAVVVAGCSGKPASETFPAFPSRTEDIFIMYSANAPRAAPGVFSQYLTPLDFVRIESLPRGVDVARKHRYVLPTSLRERWAGDAGVRYWVDRGCGPRTPGVIVYDPEDRDLTPVAEIRRLAASIRRASRLVASTGCHRFGLAPGPTPFFGLDPASCGYDLQLGDYKDVPWPDVDIIDIQAQRLLGGNCAHQQGVDTYYSLVSSVASFVRSRNPDIAVVAQVSFRDNPPERMTEAIARVADVIDGIYFSYPYTETQIPCRYCSPANLRTLLDFLR